MRGDSTEMPRRRGGVQILFQKLREQTGETLSETLVSMLIIVLAMFMLAGAIVTSARINARMEDENGKQIVQCTMDPTKADTKNDGATVSIGGVSAPVTLYTENGYTYYTVIVKEDSP